MISHLAGAVATVFAVDRGMEAAFAKERAEQLLDPAREGGVLELHRGDAAGLVPSTLSYRGGWLHGEAPEGWSEPQVLARGTAGAAAPRDTLVVIQL